MKQLAPCLRMALMALSDGGSDDHGKTKTRNVCRLSFLREGAMGARLCPMEQASRHALGHNTIRNAPK